LNEFDHEQNDQPDDNQPGEPYEDGRVSGISFHHIHWRLTPLRRKV
jgi:hypothetical protein